MSAVTRKARAARVLAYLRETGPATAPEIARALTLTKSATDDALYLLGSRALVEYAHPTTSPLTYCARPEEAS